MAYIPAQASSGTPTPTPTSTKKGAPPNQTIINASGLIPNLKTFFYFGISGLALIALTGFLPKVGIMLAIILVVGVLLNNWNDYKGYFPSNS